MPPGNMCLYRPEQLGLANFLDRTGMDASECDLIIRKVCPHYPRWHDCLFQDPIRTPLELMTTEECKEVRSAVDRHLRAKELLKNRGKRRYSKRPTQNTSGGSGRGAARADTRAKPGC